METDRTTPVHTDPSERKADAFRKVLELTGRIEACLRRGETEDVAGLLNERQLWMDRIDTLAGFRASRREGKARKSTAGDAAPAAIGNAERSRIARLIRACIDRNGQCEEILQSACEKAREAVAAMRPAGPAFSSYPDARNRVPRFVDVRS